MACLPSKGFSVEQLQRLVELSEQELEGLIHTCSTTASLLNRKNGLISFAQHGPKNVAYRLIPPDEAPRIHQKISMFLRQEQFGDDYIYDAANHALQARELGLKDEGDNAEYIQLLLKAASTTASRTSFKQAMRFMDAAESESSSRV